MLSAPSADSGEFRIVPGSEGILRPSLIAVHAPVKCSAYHFCCWPGVFPHPPFGADRHRNVASSVKFRLSPKSAPTDVTVLAERAFIKLDAGRPAPDRGRARSCVRSRPAASARRRQVLSTCARGPVEELATPGRTRGPARLISGFTGRHRADTAGRRSPRACATSPGARIRARRSDGRQAAAMNGTASGRAAGP